MSKMSYFTSFSLVTARLAKRAKVMFSLCMSVHRGGVPRSNIFGGGGPGLGGAKVRPPPQNFFLKILKKNFFWNFFFFFFLNFFFCFFVFLKKLIFLCLKKIFFLGGGNGDTKNGDTKMATQKWQHKVGGRGRYASCGHAGGLSCL